MFEFTAKLLKKQADAWDGVDTKIHLQDDHYSAKKVWNAVREQFGTLMSQYKIKNQALKVWVDHYGIAALDPKSPDPAVRKAAIDIRNYLNELAATKDKGGSFRDNEITAFRSEYGSNVSEWLQALVGGKRSSLLVKKIGADWHSNPYSDKAPSDEDDADPATLFRETDDSHDSR